MILSDLEILDAFYLTKEQKEKLILFYNFVIEENKKFNLTAITNEEDFIIKHFYDSLAISLYSSFFEHSKVCDLGPGAGFPSIPLAIKYPNVNFYLVETNKKKCQFIELIKEKLNLENIYVINKRFEELDCKYRHFFDYGITRAVSELRIISELILPFIKVDGLFYAYKGVNYLEEVNKAQTTLKVLNSKIIFEFKYTLPFINQDRFIIIIKKNKEIDIKYPRSYSLILKKSL
ncbi:MAG TPA: 16S rRNA (guanine(527)-N(7))-methyltransferase RsmG [Firmicutes bacterium]|nr:16S rRNA (guanine(527)-N(7))-methyltransferase RsmG [Bacillota bacterium]